MNVNVLHATEEWIDEVCPYLDKYSNEETPEPKEIQAMYPCPLWRTQWSKICDKDFCLNCGQYLLFHAYFCSCGILLLL
jgi:hypothetical protein